MHYRKQHWGVFLYVVLSVLREVTVGYIVCGRLHVTENVSPDALNWDEIVDEDDDDENSVDLRAPSGGRCRPGNGNHNDNGEGEEDTQGSEKGTRKGKGTKDGKGKGKGKRKGKGNGKGKCIVKQTPRGDDIAHAVAFAVAEGTERGRLGHGGLIRVGIFRAGSIARRVNFLR